MLNRYAGNLESLQGRPKIVEELVGGDYPEYRYLMFSLPILLDAKVVVETGLGHGQSSRIHLESLSFLSQPRELHTYTIEDQNYPYSQVKESIRNLNLPAKWNLKFQDSVQGGREWNGPKIPVLYLDSAHELEHVTNELDVWSPHMADKAVIYTDDIWCENTPHQALNKVNPGVCPTDPYWAIDKFAKQHPEWKQITFSYPQGKAMLLRGFELS
jgi:cephalosporin hydroxylase